MCCCNVDGVMLMRMSLLIRLGVIVVSCIVVNLFSDMLIMNLVFGVSLCSIGVKVLELSCGE